MSASARQGGHNYTACGLELSPTKMTACTMIESHARWDSVGLHGRQHIGAAGRALPTLVSGCP